MLNGHPVFALCTSQIHNPEILESVAAFVKEVHARGYSVLVFNAALERFQNKTDVISGSSVFELIPFRIVDMIVLMNETISNPIAVEALRTLAKEHDVPMMSYDGKMDGMPSVYSYSYQAFPELLEHVFGHHGCKRVNLLTGIRGHYGSECMVVHFREALSRHGLPFEDDRVDYGDYWEGPAIEAAERFLRKDTPEAIVCVNDEMAIAVCTVLRNHGLRVPEDVIVTGSDGIIREHFHSPRLTTCLKDYDRLSAAALDTAELILDGESVELDMEIPPVMRISESCGCCVTEQRDQTQAINDLHRKLQTLMIQESEEHWILGNMLERKQPTVIDFLDVLAGHIPEESYLCLRDCLSAEVSSGSLQQFADPSELMSSVMHKRKEKQFSIIQRSQLIPNLENVLASGKAVILNAIYMQNEVFGYYAYYGDSLEEESFRLPKLIHTAGNIIGSCLATSRLQAMNEKLVAARIRDSLTGMLNLHGALKVIGDRLQVERHEGERLMMVVIGLNRLRQINSIFGRAEGDQALLSLSGAITDSIDSDAIAARIGGDEFLIAFFSSSIRMNTAEALISVLKRRVVSYNQVSGKSYTLEITVSRASAVIDSGLSPEALLSEAVAAKEAQKHDGKAADAKPAVSESEIAIIERVLNENLLDYYFQPIVSAKTGQIFAYEALMRTAGGLCVSPLAILNYAAGANRLYEVEWLTYNNVLKYVKANRERFADKRVFINSIPGHFLNETDYLKIKEMYGDIMPQIVVEFTEQAETEGEELRMMQQRCAETHMDIAVDDYGTGYSNISNLLRYSPNYVKIDRSLISNIQEEPKKQHFVTNIIEFAHANGFMALAEGVETVEEMRAVIRFGADLIQGNYTSVPFACPPDRIAPRIAAMISKFSASAAKQLMQKTYMLSGEKSIELPQLDAEHYTDLFIAQPELEIVGDFDETSCIHIKIKDNTDCKIILRNVHFSSPQQTVAPAITLGKNSTVTLEFQGDNRMDAGGILVPETSTLQLTGMGNLSIRTDDTKAFAIGNDPDFASGNIHIDLSGCLNIISNGNQCVGIGGGIGKGQDISVTGTKLFFEMSGKYGIGIGVLDGNANISVSGCESDFTVRMASCIAVGSAEGAPNVRCNTASISLRGSGNQLGVLGSISGGGVVAMRDSVLHAELMGQNIFGVGSGDGRPNVSLRQCRVDLKAEGTRAMDFGSYTLDSALSVIDSDLNIIIRSAKALHFAADPSQSIHTGGINKVAINQ